MPTVAEQLRAAREAHGLTVYEVADITKIRTDHIRALEESNYDVFAAPVYIRGFVRTYARLLRMDLDLVMSTLDAELGQSENFQEHPSLTGGKKSVLDLAMLQLSRVKWQVVVPLVTTILLLIFAYWGYATWQRQQDRDPLADLGPGLYAPPDASENDVLTVPTGSTNTTSPSGN